MEDNKEDGSGVVDISNNDESTIKSEQNTDRSFLPEEYRNDSSFKDYKDLTPILKTYKEQEKANSKAITFVPDEKAPQEQWDKFYNKIGRPENPDGYQPPKRQLPEGYQRNDDLIKNVKEMAHKVGLRPEQFHGLFDIIEQANVENYKQEQKLDEEFEQILDKNFGDKKDEAINVSTEIASKYLPEDLKEYFVSGLKENNKTMITMAKILHGIHGDYMKGDVITDINKGASGSEAIESEYFKVRQELDGMNQYDPRYAELLSKKIELAGKRGKPFISMFDDIKKK